MHDLDEPKSDQQFGNLFKSFRYLNNMGSEVRKIEFFYLIFFVRRIVFTVFTVYCSTQPSIQAVCQMVISQGITLYMLINHIFEEKRQLVVEIANEMLLTMTSVLIVGTLQCETTAQKDAIGIAIMIVLALCLAINIIFFIVVMYEQHQLTKKSKERIENYKKLVAAQKAHDAANENLEERKQGEPEPNEASEQSP